MLLIITNFAATTEQQMSAPLFSIITVTYNAAATVGVTMRSVAAQTYTDYEHLIVDGASKDDTLRLAEELGTERTNVKSEPDHGLYDAMNKGITRARGRYLIFLNAGDAFHAADTLQIIADAILANNGDGFPGVVYGQTDLVDAEGRYLGPRHLQAPETLSLKSFAKGMLVCHQAFVALREIVPLYDTRWHYSADYEWCLRVLQRSRCNVNTHATLIDYLSEGMTTANRRASLGERFKIMCRYYGTVPTLLRHVGFALRMARRKLMRRPG